MKLAKANWDSVDNQVDTTTGTVKLRAVFDNRGRKLFPQQFVNAKLLVDTLQGAIIVPTAAIQLGAPGSYVYVVNADSTVSVRVIKPGPIDGERAAILSGLDEGETVVNDGVDRLYDGAKVQLPEKRPASNDSRKAASIFRHDRTDRLESIIMAGTETSNEDILRTRLNPQQALPLVGRTLARLPSSDESVPPVYSPAGCNLALDDCNHARRGRFLHVSSDFSPSGSRLSHAFRFRPFIPVQAQR